MYPINGIYLTKKTFCLFNWTNRICVGAAGKSHSHSNRQLNFAKLQNHNVTTWKRNLLTQNGKKRARYLNNRKPRDAIQINCCRNLVNRKLELFCLFNVFFMLIDFRLFSFLLSFWLCPQRWEIVYLPMAVNWVNYVDEMLIVNRAWSVTYQQPAVPVYAVPQWLLPNNTQRTVLHPAIVISQGKNLFYE